MTRITLNVNGSPTIASDGESLMAVCEAHGLNVPRLCHHAGLSPHGSCRLCVVDVDGHVLPACLTAVAHGQNVQTDTPRLQHLRLRLTQLLFTEGQHFCPSCEMSGNCQLQAMAYDVGMLDSHFPHGWPRRHLDASHPDLLIDRDRCIQCALCVRSSHEQDAADVFALGGRGAATQLLCNSASGRLAATLFSVRQRAAHICPTGALLLREGVYEHPIGTRVYDQQSLHERGNHRPDESAKAST